MTETRGGSLMDPESSLTFFALLAASGSRNNRCCEWRVKVTEVLAEEKLGRKRKAA